MKRLLALTLALLLMVTVGAWAGFPDVTDPELLEQAAFLQQLAIISGYPDGGLHGSDVLKRDQFCKMSDVLLRVKDVSAYSGYIIFPDVPVSHWAVGYINCAVRELKTMAGYPDGKFHPGDPIKLEQAVSVLCRALGYTDKMVGANWPYSYLNKAASIGITEDVNLKAGDSVTRADAVRLFYNTLFTPKVTDEQGGTGDPLIISMGAKDVENAIILSTVNEGNGKKAGLNCYVGGDMKFYPTRANPDAALASRKADLFVDPDGYVITITPHTQSNQTIIAEKFTAHSIADLNERVLSGIPTACVLFTPDGGTQTYGGIWSTAIKGQTFKFYYDENGNISYGFWDAADIEIVELDEHPTIALVDFKPTRGVNPLTQIFGPEAKDVAVFKNEKHATWADIAEGDSVVWFPKEKIVRASDFMMTATVEAVTPNALKATGVKVFGKELKIYPRYEQNSEKKWVEVGIPLEYKVGDRVNVLFSYDKDRIAYLLPFEGGDTVREIGVVESLEDGKTKIQFANGFEISGSVGGGIYSPTGSIVEACGATNGGVFNKPVTVTGGRYGEADFAALTLGSKTISPSATVIDRVGENGRAAVITPSDVPFAQVPAQKVTYAEFNSSGAATVIVLDDATGYCYDYGYLGWSANIRDEVNKHDMGPGVMVTNSLGTLGYPAVTGMELTGIGARTPGGLSVNTSGFAQKFIVLKPYNALHDAFNDEMTAVRLNGRWVSIATNVVLHNTHRDTYSDNRKSILGTTYAYTVYLDKSVEEGGVVRMITFM